MTHAATFLDRETVFEIAFPILRERLKEFGVVGLQLIEEIDFDGASILRMNVIVEQPFTARAMTDARDAIRVQLLERDDQRSVYLRAMSGQTVE